MLEYVVRPFQQRNGAIVIPSTPSAPTEKATLTWGASTGLQPTAKGMNFNVVCCKEHSDEDHRDSDQVKITNPNDDQQWVMVDRARTIYLQKIEQNQCGDNWDQFSGVGLEITATLAEFQDAMTSGTAAGNDQPSQCQQKWNFKNQQQ